MKVPVRAKQKNKQTKKQLEIMTQLTSANVKINVLI